ncbi:metallophosphoesterase [uncultured Litoreibacter sp.]|uniref:metallophosphoesterase n=1 Tax=uncultured Litoreibacter sp. TaxID=1392394 RepID=UPI0026330880|nr:metallophosphoesterase [uncultured Litoreibacter sp.]
MTIWYTADTHFGHENIMRFCNRPFVSASQMDAAMLENMWKVVGPEDQLWILGDFAFGSRAKDSAYVAQIFNQLPGAERHLVVGNHDHKPTLELPWDSVSQFAELRDGPQNQLNTLCHYPMITWNHARRGALQLFGHVHNNWRGSRNSVNVGVDVWDFMPITFADIARRAKKLPPNKHWCDVEHGAESGT